MFSNGSCVGIKVGRRSMDAKQIFENINRAIKSLNEVLDGQMDVMKIVMEFEQLDNGTLWPYMPI